MKLKLLFIILCSNFIFAQTPEQIRWVNAQSTSKLPAEFMTKFEQSLEERKSRIEAYVKKNNIPYIQRNKDGIVTTIYDVIDGQPIYLQTDNTRAAEYTRITQLQDNQLLNLNLSGQGYKVYVWDSGHARLTHQEFQNDDNQTKIRIGEGASAYSLDSHATHVTGTIAAKGKRFDIRGGAYLLDSIIAYDFFNADQEAFDLVGDGILTSNHSYGFSGSNIQSLGLSNLFGAYMDRSRNWDVITFNDPYHLPVISAGNDGNASFNDNPLDPTKPTYDKLSGAKTSKNTLVVANGMRTTRTPKGEFISGEITSSSSQGPTDDLRVKPDITGIGFFILSTESANDQAYGPKTGTSMAAPNVSGATLLLQELYNNKIGNLARAATIKGLLLHAADDAGLEGPDAIYGWGFMNAEKAAKLIIDKDNFSIVEERNLNDTETYTIEVYANGIDPLVASISWTDIHGVENTNLNDPTPALINDLDLKITQGVDEFFPWKLTGVDSNTKGVNNVDNFEKIEIPLAEGTYTLEVTHKGSLLFGNQNYTLIVSGISPNPINCNAPLGLVTSNLTSNSVEVSWDNIVGATSGYEFALMEPGKNPDEHTPLDQGNLAFEVNELQLSNLSPSTDYDLFVRSNCGSSESLWNSVEFSTSCGTVTAFPFTENFNPNSGNCWFVTTTVPASFWRYQIGFSHSQGTTMPVSGGRMATFISKNSGDVVGLVSPYFENTAAIPLEVGFYFIQPSNSGLHNTTRILKQVGSATPTEIFQLSDAVNNWEEIKIPLNNNTAPFRIIIETTNAGGAFTAFDDFQVRFNGYIYNDLVWQPRNPQNVSTLDDSWLLKNNNALLTENSFAKEIYIEEGASLEVASILSVNENIEGDGLLRFLQSEHYVGQLASLLPTSQVTVTTEVERWNPAGNQNRRAFRMISSAVNSTGSIFENWQENGTSPEGFGTHITGSATGEFGFDTSLTGQPSLFVFNHSIVNQSGGTAWEPISNTDNTFIEAGKPYRLFVRGDRNLDLTNPNENPNNTTLRTKGNLHTGNYSPTLALGNGQFNFVGNPYPSIVNINSIAESGDINKNYVYVWEPSLNTQGGFATIELPNGTNITGGNANQFLMPGQGFFIRNNLTVTTPPSLFFSESSKDPYQDAPTVFSNNEDEIIHIELKNNERLLDAVKIAFNTHYSSSVSELDAAKMGNINENLAIVKENALFSIVKQQLDFTDEVYLFLNQTTTGNYQLAINSTLEQNLYLVDHYTNTNLLVEGNKVYPFSINEAIPASMHPLRFSLVFQDETLGVSLTENSSLLLYPNPANHYVTIENRSNLLLSDVYMYGIDGKLIQHFKLNDNDALQRIDLSSLNRGIYIIKVMHENGVYQSKLIKE